MDEVMVRFIHLLRQAGLRVSSSEALDAMRGASSVGLGDRDTLKSALRATLVKRSDDITTFDPLFDQFFGGGEGQSGQGQPGQGQGQGNPLWQRQMDIETALRMALEELARMGRRPGELSRSVLRGDMSAVLALMAMLGLLGQQNQQRGQPGQPGQPNGEGQPGEGQPQQGGRPQRGQRGQRGQTGQMSAWQMLEQMGWDRARQEMMQMLDALEKMGERELARLLRQRIREVEELFPRWVAAEAADQREREQEQQQNQGATSGEGPNTEGVQPDGPNLEKKDFSQFTQDEIRAMEAMVQQLAKRLSQDWSRRRQVGGRKRLDFSRTMRASMATNGVPMELWFKQPRRNRLRIVVLCDVSSSVRNASRFMLQLLYSLQHQRGRVRSFVFISDLTEVTSYFQTHTIDEAVDMATAKADIRYWAHSDFGRAFRTFVDKYPDALTSRTIVLILGDGRSNFYDPQLDALTQVHQQAKRVIWLNPESRWGWGSGDSIIDLYSQECDVLEECRNLEQLAAVMQTVND
ncbi:MAG: VWA domain-containing protein [Anaerolineae bacterium]|nr:VWA domain-containing protein [Anaerolineae bacterium]